jgi:hypothetical protein
MDRNYLKHQIIGLLLVVSATVAGHYVYQKYQHKDLVESYESGQKLIENAEILRTLWLEGDYNNQLLDKKINCQKYTGIINPQQLKCNMQIIECFLKKLEAFKNLTYSRDQLLAAGRFKIIPKNSFLMTLKLENHQITLSFDQSCREIYLPQRIFTMEDSNEKKYSWWDNFNRNLFLDKYLVSEFDVVQWLNSDRKFSGRKELIKKYSNKSFKPAFGLRADEMARFCQFHGKQLLTSKLFNSAAMHPGDFNNTKPKYPIRSPWPWSRKMKVGPVYDVRVNQNNKEIEVTKAMCQQVYSKECNSKYPELANQLGTPSWIGLFQILGHDMEYLENHSFFKKNLKASSFYFSMDSVWNEIGKRAYWDGTYYGSRSFNFRLNDPKVLIQQLNVGFRCYRELFQ